MIRKFIRKNIKKWFPIFFEEMLKEEYQQRLYASMRSQVSDEDICNLYSSIRQLSSRPEDFDDTYQRIKARLNADDQLMEHLNSTLSMLERRNFVTDVSNRINEMVIKDYAIMLPHHGERFRIEAGAQIYAGENIEIGDFFHAGYNLRLQTVENFKDQRLHPHITIGEHVSIEDHCKIVCVDNIEIGDGTMIASRVFITDHFHGSVCSEELDKRPAERAPSHKPVKIGKNVWIGEGVCIMPGVELGDNVIVGANAVVTHSFEQNSVIAGCPARLIKTL